MTDKAKEEPPSLVEDCLLKEYGNVSKKILSESKLLQYIKRKTGSVGSSPKSRPNLANITAVYVVVEDYIEITKDGSDYSTYEGAKFKKLWERQKKFPGCEKIQNHALNSRCNMEFSKYFPGTDPPIDFNQKSSRYKVNVKLLEVTVDGKKYDIANTILDIINNYTSIRSKLSQDIIEKAKKLKTGKPAEIEKFIESMIGPTSDSRMFEVMSYVILKNYYSDQTVFFGKTRNDAKQVRLELYKTGRVGANDGGIDFVLRPYGMFFQATEVLDFGKFFLDIDKISRFPITFVVKSDKSESECLKILKEKAAEEYEPEIVKKYMNAIEKIFTIPDLIVMVKNAVKNHQISNLLDDFIVYYTTEFNF